MSRNRWRGEGDGTHVDDDDEIISEVVTLGSALDEPEPAPVPRYRARGNLIEHDAVGSLPLCCFSTRNRRRRGQSHERQPTFITERQRGCSPALCAPALAGGGSSSRPRLFFTPSVVT